MRYSRIALMVVIAFHAMHIFVPLSRHNMEMRLQPLQHIWCKTLPIGQVANIVIAE